MAMARWVPTMLQTALGTCSVDSEPSHVVPTVHLPSAPRPAAAPSPSYTAQPTGGWGLWWPCQKVSHDGPAWHISFASYWSPTQNQRPHHRVRPAVFLDDVHNCIVPTCRSRKGRAYTHWATDNYVPEGQQNSQHTWPSLPGHFIYWLWCQGSQPGPHVC